MGGLFILVMAVLATATFLFTSIKYGFKRAKKEHDEEDLAGVFFIFMFGGIIIGTFILDYIIPESKIEIRVVSIFLFIWIWFAICEKFSDFLNR